MSRSRFAEPLLGLVYKTVIEYAMFAPGGAVVAGVSGGADSVAMLRCLLLLKDALGVGVIAAAHINHNLRGAEAKADEAFVIDVCESWGVPLNIYQADVRGLSESEKISLEDAARRLRYGYLNEALAAFGAERIAVAHNRDDNAETVLLNLARGTGLKGLCGIAPVRGAVVRPLIEAPREMIERFLAGQNIAYRTDNSNFDARHSRNRIRHTVIPVFEQAAGARFKAVAARGSKLLREDDAFLTEYAKEAYSSCIVRRDTAGGTGEITAVTLDIKKLSALPPAIKRRVIREGAAEIAGLVNIGGGHIESVIALLNNETGKQVCLPRGVTAKRVYGELTLKSERAAPGCSGKCFSYKLTPESVQFIPEINKHIRASFSPPGHENGYTKIFRYDNISLRFRSRLPGDFLRLEGAGRRKLQDYFTDRKTPRDMRDSVPLVAAGSEILWILDGSGKDGEGRVNGCYKAVPGNEIIYVSVY